jgi:23S rRNA pseudouridine1911/1915/1917 synthase
VTIRTGVTHQIRCQLALGGLPIVNDLLYGARPLGGASRHFLHAAEIRFRHPLSDAPAVIQAPLTDDFARLMDALR